MRTAGLSLIFILLPGYRAMAGQESPSPARLRELAREYYLWRNENHPVSSSYQGLHTWDDKLTDYSQAAIAARRRHINELLSSLKAAPAGSWSRDDRIDWMLFRAQLEHE